MEHIHAKVRGKSKFLRVLQEYDNGGGAATPAGANPGAAAGTAPVVPAGAVQQQNQQLDPKVQKAQELAKKAQMDAAKAELQAVQSSMNNHQARLKQLQDILKGKPAAAATASPATAVSMSPTAAPAGIIT